MRLEQGQILKKTGAPGRQTAGGRSRQAVHTTVWAARQQAGERWTSAGPIGLSTRECGQGTCPRRARLPDACPLLVFLLRGASPVGRVLGARHV